VRIADLIAVTSSNRSARAKVFWSIAAKHVDFVLADHETLRPRIAIELDDSSHRRADRQERDALVNEIFRRAELPLLRFTAQASYDRHELLSRIDGAVSKARALRA
jgi:very-short-patch-repair endonuclease